MGMNAEHKEILREAMNDYEILLLPHGVYSLKKHLESINKVREQLGMEVKWGFPSCDDCKLNYIKEIYNIWRQ